jgi:hypothetical protein
MRTAGGGYHESLAEPLSVATVDAAVLVFAATLTGVNWPVRSKGLRAACRLQPVCYVLMRCASAMH